MVFRVFGITEATKNRPGTKSTIGTFATREEAQTFKTKEVQRFSTLGFKTGGIEEVAIDPGTQIISPATGVRTGRKVRPDIEEVTAKREALVSKNIEIQRAIERGETSRVRTLTQERQAISQRSVESFGPGFVTKRADVTLRIGGAQRIRPTTTLQIMAKRIRGEERPSILFGAQTKRLERFEQQVERQRQRDIAANIRATRTVEFFRRVPFLRGERFAQRAGRFALAAPTLATVGFGEFLASSAEKTKLTIQGLLLGGETRRAVTGELRRALKETPRETARLLDPRTPEGLVRLGLIGLGVAGRRVKIRRTERVRVKRPRELRRDITTLRGLTTKERLRLARIKARAARRFGKIERPTPQVQRVLEIQRGGRQLTIFRDIKTGELGSFIITRPSKPFPFGILKRPKVKKAPTITRADRLLLRLRRPTDRPKVRPTVRPTVRPAVQRTQFARTDIVRRRVLTRLDEPRLTGLARRRRLIRVTVEQEFFGPAGRRARARAFRELTVTKQVTGFPLLFVPGFEAAVKPITPELVLSRAIGGLRRPIPIIKPISIISPIAEIKPIRALKPSLRLRPRQTTKQLTEQFLKVPTPPKRPVPIRRRFFGKILPVRPRPLGILPRREREEDLLRKRRRAKFGFFLRIFRTPTGKRILGRKPRVI